MAKAPADSRKELAAAKAACKYATGEFRSLPLPFFFERALVAQMEERPRDARTDLEQVLATFPGCFTAAFAVARVELAAGDPGRAIRWLLPVEREVANTREGAVLLADAVRAIGLYETASRYDLAALLNRGGYDSRGNDCSPVDVTGEFSNDIRMPQIFYFEMQPDDTILCNARGVYYNVRPVFGLVLRAFARVRKPSLSGFLSIGEAIKRNSTHPLGISLVETGIGAQTRRMGQPLKALLVGLRFPGRGPQLPQKFRQAARRRFRRISANNACLAAGIAVAVWRPMRRLYRTLPISVRHRAYAYVQIQACSFNAWLRYAVTPHLSVSGKWSRWTFSKISEQGATARLLKARRLVGLVNVFGLKILSDRSDDTGRAFGKDPAPDPHAIGSMRTFARFQMPAPGELPPKAAQLLSQLISELES
jgi:hypothetical protein